VYAMQTEKRVREEACTRSGALSYEVTVSRDGDTARVQIDRSMPAAVPEFVRKFIGDKVNIRQVEEWGAPDSTGTRTAKLRVTIQGQPATMDGSIVSTPSGAETVAQIDGEVKVAVPFLGKKIEPEIHKAILAAIRVDHEVGSEWLTKQ